MAADAAACQHDRLSAQCAECAASSSISHRSSRQSMMGGEGKDVTSCVTVESETSQGGREVVEARGCNTAPESCSLMPTATREAGNEVRVGTKAQEARSATHSRMLDCSSTQAVGSADGKTRVQEAASKGEVNQALSEKEREVREWLMRRLHLYEKQLHV